MCVRARAKHAFSVGLVDAMPDNVQRDHFSPLVTGAHVSVDIAAQIAAVPAIRALESRVLPADIQQMPVEAVFPLEGASARETRVQRVLSGDKVEGLQVRRHQELVTWKIRKQRARCQWCAKVAALGYFAIVARPRHRLKSTNCLRPILLERVSR